MEVRTKNVSFVFVWFALVGFALGLVLVVNVSPVSAAKAEKALVDLNSASQKELEALPGVGAATAKKITANRPYKSVDELSKAGLSEKLINTLRPLVTVGSATPAKEPATKAKAPAPPASAAKAEKALVDLNSASQKELEALPGVGAATAKKITANRPYKSVDELSKAGLSAKRIDTLRPLVTTGPAAPAKEAATKAPAPPAAAKVTSETTAPRSGKQSPPAAAKLAPGEKVNINTASQQQLEALPGIGPAKAKAIIEGRPYDKIEDVMKVKGIKQGVFNKIKDLITVR